MGLKHFGPDAESDRNSQVALCAAFDPPGRASERGGGGGGSSSRARPSAAHKRDGEAEDGGSPRSGPLPRLAVSASGKNEKAGSRGRVLKKARRKRRDLIRPAGRVASGFRLNPSCLERALPLGILAREIGRAADTPSDRGRQGRRSDGGGTPSRPREEGRVAGLRLPVIEESQGLFLTAQGG